MSRQKLSVIVITRNEEAVLGACLESVRWADERVVYDSDSTDRTREIAESYGAKFVNDSVWEGFGIQRRKAQAAASGDWILMIDADEVLTPTLRESIEAVLQSPPEHTVYRLSRRDLFFGKPLRCAETSPIRLYPRSFQYRDQRIHESVDSGTARVLTLKGFMLHDTCRSFESFQLKRLRYAMDWANERFSKGRRVSLFTVPPRAFFTGWGTLFLRGGIWDGARGFLYAVLMAQYTFNKYAMLWVLGLPKKEPDA